MKRKEEAENKQIAKEQVGFFGGVKQEPKEEPKKEDVKTDESE